MCQTGVSSMAGDWSPHRSTVEPKERSCDRGSSDDFSFGEPDTLSHEDSFSLDVQSSQPYSIVMPSFREIISPDPANEIRYRCVSNESLAAACGTQTGNDGLFPPVARKVSLEPLEEAKEDGYAQLMQEEDARPKRRRNSNMASRIVDGIRPMEEDMSPAQGKSRKRRRLHERKRAMDSSAFAAVLAQIGM